MKQADLVGKKYGRINVIAKIGKNKYKQILWQCICDCGNERIYTSSYLKSKAHSCGCYFVEIMGYSHKSHGLSKKIPEYAAWENMKRRCYYSKGNRYSHYGARGVSVCAQWINSFEQFLADMGKRPTSQHSLDRYPNKDGNYEPGNCRWATSAQQNRNYSRNIIITHRGESRILSDWVGYNGIKIGTLTDRYRKYGYYPAIFDKKRGAKPT